MFEFIVGAIWLLGAYVADRHGMKFLAEGARYAAIVAIAVGVMAYK